MASETLAGRRVVRFGRTERVLHWVHAAGFGVLLLSGLFLYWPVLAQVLSDRPLVKTVHLLAAVTWLAALVLVVAGGDHRALRRTRRELEAFSEEDVAWLRRRPGARAGRFNAGQKLHSAVQAALAVLLTVSGVLLWLGERDTTFRLAGTIPLHDGATLLLLVLVAGHVWMAVFAPGTRGAMEGIVRGTVSEEYAARHHPDWRPSD
jgi:formate dehydrogenase subunit gamma